jgi:hypothetical protein
MQRMAASGLEAISYCAWEQAFTHGNASLQIAVGKTLEEGGIGNLLTDVERLPYDQVRLRVERRLRNLNTLPTMPEIGQRSEGNARRTRTCVVHGPGHRHELLQVMRTANSSCGASGSMPWRQR